MFNRIVLFVFTGIIGTIRPIYAQTTHYVSTFSDLTSKISSAASGDIIEIQNDLTTSSPASGFSAITISKTLTINGNGNTITVPITGVTDGGINNTGSSGTSTATSYRVLETSGSSVTITINDWVIKGGNIGSNGAGGCIRNSANKLVLNDVTISNGRSSYTTSGSVVLGNGGGGIYNSGRLYMNRCMVTRNSAGYGGGMLNDGGYIYGENSTFTENRSEYSLGGGGACESKNSGFLYINNCTFSNNYSTEHGGAINNYLSTLYVANSTFTGNVCYGDFGGAAIANRSNEYILNCIFAYNYYRSSGTTSSPSAFSLDDFAIPTSSPTNGTNVNCYYSIHHTSNNKINNSTSIGNITYTGAADGSDNSIFAGGIYTKITNGNGVEIGTGKVFQPLLVTSSEKKTATLKLSSFANNSSNKGVVTGYTNGGGTPSMGYKNPSNGSWVNLTGSSASSNTVTKDQLGTTRNTTAPTRGSVETEIATVYMLKAISATNGSTSGASLYGDVYASGTQITVTALANTGYQFSNWKDVSSGSTLSSSNPYTITLTSNLTIEPIFSVASTTYTVTYLGNNNSAGSTPTNQTFTSGNSIVIANQNTLIRDEYFFDGWNTQPSGGGTNYTVGSTYSMATNLTLYAKWTPYVKYYVKTGSTTALNNTSSWSGYPDGSGGAPSNFGSDKIFILDNSSNNTSFSTGGDWTVSGAIQIPLGKTLSINNNTTLTISGDFTNAGTITSAGSNSTLVFNGNVVQQYVTGTITASKLTINNTKGVNLAGSVDVTNALTLTTGNLFANGFLTFKSSINGTAIVNAVTDGTISGNVIVERYIPARRGFRLLSSPVTTTTTIYSNWQENGSNSSGLGTHITGSTTGSNGFDATQTGNYSLFSHNNSTGTWSAVTNTNINTFTAGAPYRLMIRGDRTVSLATNTPNPTNTTLRTTGTLVTGNKSASDINTTANGFSFIGNPYQAPVNMNTILANSTNINTNYYYIWDPKVSTRGAYVTVDVINNSNNVSGSAADRFLQPMQACFVKTIANGSAALTFTEASKGTGLTGVFQTAPALSTLNIQLYQSDSFNNGTLPNDGLVIHYDSSYTNALDGMDAFKPTNQDENIGIFQHSQLLSIECRNVPKENDTTELVINQIRDSRYLLQFNLIHKLPVEIYFVDRYTGNSEKLNDSGLSEYHLHFDKNIAESVANNRFYLVYKQKLALANTIEYRPTNRVRLAPNPTNSTMVTLYTSSPFNQGDVVFITDVTAKILKYYYPEADQKEIQLQLPKGIAQGIYWINVQSKDHGQTNNKLMIHE